MEKKSKSSHYLNLDPIMPTMSNSSEELSYLTIYSDFKILYQFNNFFSYLAYIPTEARQTYIHTDRHTEMNVRYLR